MNTIKINKEQLEILISLSEEQIFQYDSSGDDIIVSINDDEAQTLSDKVKDQYVFEGFDINYNVTKKGKLFECIIDLFYKIGY